MSTRDAALILSLFRSAGTLGGVIGYAKGRSMPSLVAGRAFGGIYGVAGYVARMDETFKDDIAS